MRLKPLATVILLLVSSCAVAQEMQQRRIVRPIDNASAVRLQGTLVPRARVDLDRGPVAADQPMQHMTVVFSRTAAQQAALDQLLADQQDLNSPNYHQWLTPEEFGDRFGLAQPDVDLVSAWLTAQGFTLNEIARSRTWIAFSGIAAQVEAAFHAPIHNYLVDGVTHYAPSAEVAVPSALAGVVAAITGLHDFHPSARSRVRRLSPRLTSSISGNHFLAPGDFGTIYNLPDYANGVFQPGNDGTGQTIAIVGQTRLNSTGTAPFTDIDTFRSVSSLPPLAVARTTATPNLTTVLPSGATDPNFVNGDIEEANLDIQWAGAVAPNANMVFVYSTDALLTSLPYIVTNNLAAVISVSYGECETSAPSGDITTVETSLQQANAQGQTVVVASGDNGATDCDTASPATHSLAVDYPASSVYVTTMGGTEFTGDSQAAVYNGAAPPDQYWNGSSNLNDTAASAFSYIPETTWNDSSGTTISATGGGASAKFSKPSWQTGNGVPADGHRDVPDLALSSSPAHDGYVICSQGSCQNGYRSKSDQTFTVIGGTSAAVPTFAGIAALANQKLGTRQGNLNPKIYSLAASATWAFNDITTGNNIVSCTSGTGCNSGSAGYAAGPGYDLVTGWGSVDATALLDALAGTPNPHFLVLPSSRNVSLSPGNNAAVALSVTPKEGFSGIVALTCAVSTSLSMAGATCNFDNANVTAPGSANLTIQSGSAQGGQTGTVTLQGTSGSNADSVSINITIATPDFQVSSGNSTETVIAGSTTSDTISVASVQGFTSNVNFTCSGTAGLTCSLSPTSVTASTSAAVTSALTVTASSSAVTGSITITATSGTLTHTVPIPVMVNAAPPDFTLSVANQAVSIPSGQMITNNLTVAPVGGFNSAVALTCSVPASLGTTTCTVNPLTVSGGGGAALVTINAAVLTMDHGAPLPFPHRGLGAYASFVFTLGIVFTGKPRRSRHSKRMVRSGLLGLVVLCLMFGALSCGGGSGGGSNPTSLNGNLTITGTGGGITHTTTINVTVH